ncbi:hypothetical protein EDB89DRAFT_2074212 [Lactarius sanguifluus]|nr:hypothetical protein EDB89DRAFT_2074212 [Lactarius sanguifluus]
MSGVKVVKWWHTREALDDTKVGTDEEGGSAICDQASEVMQGPIMRVNRPGKPPENPVDDNIPITMGHANASNSLYFQVSLPFVSMRSSRNNVSPHALGAQTVAPVFITSSTPMLQPCILLEMLTCHTSQTPCNRTFSAPPLYLLTYFAVHQYRDNAAYNYKLVQLCSLDPTSQATQLVALDVIATALSDPTLFDFDPLFVLLQTFLSGRPDDLYVW